MTEEEELQFALALSLDSAPPAAGTSTNRSPSASPVIPQQTLRPALPDRTMSLQEQLEEVRKQRARHYLDHQVGEAVEATRGVDRSAAGVFTVKDVKPTMSGEKQGQSRKRPLVEEEESPTRTNAITTTMKENTGDDSGDEIEFVGMVKKPKAEPRSKMKVEDRDRNRPQTQSSTSTSTSSSTYPSFPKPSIRLTRTAGRQPPSKPALQRNTISFPQITRSPKFEGLKKAFVYSFFVGQDELFRYLPVGEWAGGWSGEIIIGRDMNQDPVPHSLAPQLNLSLDPSSYHKMSTEDFQRLSLASAQVYEGLYGENFRAVWVEKRRVGCGHSKVGVLVFEGFLRVFITSANLMALDLEHGDNHWFIVDLPELPARRSKRSPTPDFEQELLEHLAALGCPKDFINSIFGRYDYSAVEDVSIVASVPSSSFYKDEEKARYGAMRLREVVKPILEEEQVKDVEMEICTASIGGMQEDWLRGMNHCFTGGRYKPLDRTDIPGFTMTFPTRSDVEATREASKEGSSQMGSHFKYAESRQEIKKMMRHYVSKDQASDGTGKGCLFHQKFYMAFPKGTREAEEKARASGQASTESVPPVYLYLGSANFSKAAWGKPTPEIKKKQPSSGEMMRLADVCNYELGVVVRGKDLVGMLEEGSRWEDVMPHERWTEGYKGKDKPYNSEVWVRR